MGITRLPRSVTRELGHYVYLYVNPENDEVFYVGKGKGGRCLSHLHGSGNRELAKRISRLKKKGLEPRVEILVHGLGDEETAHAVEAATIDLVGLDLLANTVAGRRGQCGRMSLEQVLSLYQRKRAKITEPAILIRISRLYHYGIGEAELYDATRGVWVVGKRREKAEFALAVYQGIVREVYRISRWLPAGSTFSARNPRGLHMRGRWEFVGTIAQEKIRRKYVDRSVAAHFREKGRNPITYVNC